VNDVDVVLVNYRSGPRLAAAVEEAVRWLGGRAAVTIVDNAPGDGSVELAERAHAGVRVIANEENRGFAFAVNQALRATTAPFVLLLNPDVSRIRGEFAAIERIFAADDDVAAVAPRLVGPDGSLQRSARREPRPHDLLVDVFGLRGRFPGSRRLFASHYGDWDYASTRVVDAASGAFLVLRRAALERVGPFDERYFVYAEETDWLVRAKRLGWKTVFTPEVEAVHEARASTDAGESDLVLLLVESEHKYVQKHFGAPTTLAFRGAALGVDGLRWAVAAVRGRSAHRRALARRIRVHAGGKAR
jgi:N-acetylglucosaminyl-diphospho-decaprenol L-rhamnosyltransferase